MLRTEPFPEGTILEDCPRCMGCIFELDENDVLWLCSLCNGWGYVEHEHE